MSVIIIGKNSSLNFYYKSFFDNVYKTNTSLYESEEDIPYVKISNSNLIIINSLDINHKKLNLNKVHNKVIINNTSNAVLKNKQNKEYFIHPLDVKQIQNIVKKESLTIKEEKHQYYISIPFHILEQLSETPCKIFTKKEKIFYHLLYSKGQKFNKTSKIKNEFYIIRDDYLLVLKEYVQYIYKNKKQFVNDKNIKSYVNFAYSMQNQNKMNIPNDFLFNIVGDISQTINNISSKEEISSLLDQILSKKNFFTKHSFYTLFISTYIEKELFNINREKLIIASIFHDFALNPGLNNDLEKTFYESNLSNPIFDEHTKKGVDIIHKLNIHDNEIENMISLHHNTPLNCLIENNKKISNYTNAEFIFNISHFLSLIVEEKNKENVLKKISIYKNTHQISELVLGIIKNILK